MHAALSMLYGADSVNETANEYVPGTSRVITHAVRKYSDVDADAVAVPLMSVIAELKSLGAEESPACEVAHCRSVAGLSGLARDPVYPNVALVPLIWT